jgi:hypothetical protein
MFREGWRGWTRVSGKLFHEGAVCFCREDLSICLDSWVFVVRDKMESPSFGRVIVSFETKGS